jgi:uncharacterized repeat protein (TIGR01451 family)
VTLNSSTIGSNTIKATAKLAGHANVTATTGTTGNGSNATKDYVDLKITLDPLDATNKIGDDHVITATVEVNTGGGFGPAPDGTVVDFTITGAAGFVPGGGKTTSATISNGAGTVSVTLNSSTIGSNTIKATAKLAGHANVTATTGTIGIRIEKATNGQDADAGTGPYIAVGGTVTWSYTATNLGDTPISNVVVTDDNGTPGDPTDDFHPAFTGGDTNPANGLLDPAEIWIYQATGTAVAGQYENIATVTGTPPVGDDVSDNDYSHYFGTNPGITIEKATNGQDADSAPGPTIVAGATVTWTYAVTNTGNVTLTNITVTDSDLGAVGTIASLAPGASQTLTKTGTAIAGQYANTGTATVGYGGTPYSDSDDSHYFGGNPRIAVEKTPDTQQVISGTDAMFHIRVENTGDVPLTNVVISDFFAPNCASVTIGTLAVGAVYEYDCVTPNVTTGFVNEAIVRTQAGILSPTPTPLES